MEEEIFVVTLSGILSDLCGIDLDFTELQSEAVNNMVWKYTVAFVCQGLLVNNFSSIPIP